MENSGRKVSLEGKFSLDALLSDKQRVQVQIFLNKIIMARYVQ